MSLILIVDDTPAVLRSLAKLIANAGHRVCKAKDAEEAVVVARAERPDLIVSDVNMPGRNGFELIAGLRTDPLVRDAKVIFYTSMYTEEEARGIVKGCGEFRLINKSQKIECLMEAIAAMLPAAEVVERATDAAAVRERRRAAVDAARNLSDGLGTLPLRLQSLANFSQYASRERNLRRLMDAFCVEAKRILGAHHVAVGIMEDAHASRCVVTTRPGCRRVVTREQVPQLLNEVMTSRTPARIGRGNASSPDAARLLGLPRARQSSAAMIAVPVAGKSVRGWLCVGSDERDPIGFDHEREQMAVILGAQMALAVENLRQVRLIRRQTRERELSTPGHVAELRRSNSALEQFACTAAHELQSPLVTVAGYLDRIASSAGMRMTPEASEPMEAAIAAAGRMQQLIRDVLAYSRLDGARGGVRMMDVNVALAQALENLAADVIRTGASVTWGPLPTLGADCGQLTQVFQNLILNAVTYRGANKPQVHVTASRNGDGWVISVRDNGIGIRQEDCERVFNLFERLHGRGKYPGNGIGLAACKKIVEAHGGTIWVESEFGEGSTFHFTLAEQPVMRARSAA